MRDHELSIRREVGGNDVSDNIVIMVTVEGEGKEEEEGFE